MSESILQSFNTKIDYIIAFIGGDLFTTLTIYLVGFEYFDLIHPLLKLMMALLLGAFGGLGGLLIKDFYPKIKKKIIKWFS